MGPGTHRRLGRPGAALAALCATAALCASPAAAAPDPSPRGANDFSCEPSAAHPDPVVLVHGLGATMFSNWNWMSPRIAQEGYCVFALTYGVDPRSTWLPYAPGGVIRMQESAAQLDAFVDRVLEATGAERVDLVGHSEGTVMPRWWLERLGGAARTDSFVALTPLWRGTDVLLAGSLAEGGDALGLSAPIIRLVDAFCGSCTQMIKGSDFLEELNADGEAVPGVRQTNIVTRYDELVIPFTSGLMRDGGTNIVLQEVCPLNLSEHGLVAFGDKAVLRMTLNALDPASAQPVRC
jgi:triacylglycerol esterase/lipase EstA (alpha/beta hydrolase family)